MNISVKGKIDGAFRLGVILFIALILTNSGAFAQLSGDKFIPGDYPSIKCAIIDLNSQGAAPGGVTFKVSPGFADTLWSLDSTSINITINKPGFSNPVVFQKNGFGNNPMIITSSSGTGTYSGSSIGGYGDAILRIIGNDYITFNGFDLVDSYTGTDRALLIEYGFQILRSNRSDGCKNIQFVNCGIILNGQYLYSQGIGILNYNGSGSSTNPRDYDGRHENIFIDGNDIRKVNTGIVCLGYNHTTAPYHLYENNIQIGTATANSIQLPGGSGTTSYGLYISYADSIKINGSSITGTTGAVYGIYLGTGLNSRADITSNNLYLSDTCASGDFYGIYSLFGNSGTDNYINISGNTIQNSTFTTSSTGKYYGICNSGFPYSLAVNSNTLSGITYRSSGTGGFYGIYSSAGTISNGISISGNTVLNIQNLSTSAGSTFIIYNTSTAGGTANISGNNVNGVTTYNASYNYTIAQNATAQSFVINANTVDNITKSGSSASGTVYGIYINSPVTPLVNTITNSGNCIKNITSSSTSQLFGIFNISDAAQKHTSEDTVYNLTSASGNSVYGIYYYNGTDNRVHHNSVHDLYAGGTTALTSGIFIPSYVQSMYMYNNFIYSINAPNSSSNPSVTGINIDGGSNHYIQYNTVYLSSTGTANGFSTACLYIDINPGVEISNNIIINNSSPGPAGISAAHRRKGTTLSTFLSNSNNNNYYAGTPSARNLIFYDGTNSDQTIESYKARVLPKRESFSFTENTAFINSSTQPYNLHLNPSVQTLCESGAKRITSPAITNDWDCDIRWGESGYTGNGTAPDIGADEGEFTPAVQMSYVSSTTMQTSGYVYAGNRNQEIMRIEIVTSGISNALNVTGFTVNANGTYDINDINGSEAKIFFTAGSNTFDTSTVFGSAVPQLTDFAITGSQNLVEGTNYFWLAYTVSAAAVDGNAVDGECISMDISGITRNPAVTAPPEFKTVAGLMSGTYYVGQGQSLPNFTTLTQAFHNAENRGISGPVTFILTNPPGVPYSPANGENIPLVLNTIPGAGPLNTVTVKPNAGNQSVISGSSPSAVIKFYGADYVIFEGSNNKSGTRDLTIWNNSAAGNTSAIWFTSLGTGKGSANDAIRNCNILCGSNTSETYAVFSGGMIFGQAGADNDSISITGNYIYRSMYGIYLYGNSQTSDRCKISGNTIGAPAGSTTDYIGYYGIYSTYCTYAEISGNVVRNMISENSQMKGINVNLGTVSSRISENEIYSIRYTGIDGSGAAGIYINTGNASSNDTVSNNIIYDIKADGYSGNTYSEPYGIAIEGNTGRIALYYNTVNLFGDISNSGSGYTAIPASLFVNTTSGNLDIRNNVFINTMTKESVPASRFYAIYSLSSSGAFANINYNDYYTEGSQGILGYIGSNKYTIESWRSATGKDAGSISAKPRINSNINLKPQPLSPLLSAGTPIANVPNDILGTPRSGSAPTIGVYESAIDLAGPDILFTPLSDTNATANRTTFNFAVITDPSGVNAISGTAPRFYYKKNWHANAYSGNTSAANGWKWVEGFFNDTCWNFTIDYSLLYGGSVSAGDIIQYFIAAQDNLEIPNACIYRGETAGTLVSVDLQPGNFPVTGSVYSYSITAVVPLAGDYTVGLSMFNLITGRNLKPKNYPVSEESRNGSSGSLNQFKEKSVTQGKEKPPVKKTKAPVTDNALFEENGKNYTGPLYAPLTKEQKVKYNLSDRLTGVYANITSAVNDLNNSGISDNVRFLLLDAAYGNNGTPETFPIRINRTNGANPLSTVTIQPQTGITSTIQSDDIHAIFDLNGANYICFDGRMNGSQSGKNLTIRNVNSSFDSSSVIRFTNDARRNTLQYCNIEGNSTATAKSGLVFFAATNLQGGNDSNLVQFNDIRNRSDSAGCYRYGIYSYGSNTTPAANNSDNTITGNNIYNFWQNESMSSGIYLYYGTGDNWTISGNSFYQTEQRNFNTSSITGWNVINLGYLTVNNLNVTGNFIGGTNANCGGTSWTANFTPAGNFSRFYGITGITGSNTPSGINGNRIQNIAVTFDISSYSNSFLIFAPIMVDLTGTVNIGTAGGNIIGDTAGTGSISINLTGNSNYSPLISGIEHRADGNVCNNLIGSFNITVSGNLANGYEFNGINRNSISTGNQTITGNTIGSRGTAGSISHIGSNSAMKFNGIKSDANSQTLLISGNIVSNINGNSTSATSYMRGIILSGQSVPSIVNNGIYNLYSLAENENNNTSVNCALTGIAVNSPAVNSNISGNIINALQSSITSAYNTNVNGICVNNSSASGKISGNRIYNLINNSTGTSPGITGIANCSGNWSVSNNQITLTNGETAAKFEKNSGINAGNYSDRMNTNLLQLYGIYDNSSSSGTYYYNTVYAGGTVTSGSLNSYCIYRNSNSNITLKNNLLYNGRTRSGTATGNNYALGTPSTSPVTSNCNSYVTVDTLRSMRFGGSSLTFSQWKSSTSGDRHSYSTSAGIIPYQNLFISTSDGNLSINKSNKEAWLVSGKGTPVTGYLSDFDSASVRSEMNAGGVTDIGSDEFTETPPDCPLLTQTSIPAPGTFSSYVLYGRTVCTIYWDTSGASYPGGMDIRYFSGINPPSAYGNFAKFYIDAEPSGSLAGTTYDFTIYFSPGETYSINNPSTDSRMCKYSSGSWVSYSGLGTANFQTELDYINCFVRVRGLNSFSYYTITDVNVPLPVTIESFRSTVREREIELRWITGTEYGNSGFEIQRNNITETDKGAWETMGFVRSAGNGRNTYEFTDKKLNTGKYLYRLKQTSNNGTGNYFYLPGVIEISMPDAFQLSQNYPNPFNPDTRIDFSLPAYNRVTIVLYDILGREVKTILNENMKAGFHTIRFRSDGLSSGTYFYRMNAGKNGTDFVSTRKMSIVK